MRKYLFSVFLTGLIYSHSCDVVKACLIPESFSESKGYISNLAESITVRVIMDSERPSGGSGAIIARQGQTYTVVTNYHVIGESSQKKYVALTSDGIEHQVHSVRNERIDLLDISFIQFDSPQHYPVATIGNSLSLSLGDSVYASGYPTWHFTYEGDIPIQIESTLDWGQDAYCFTIGTVESLGIEGLSGGYQIGYNNDISQGMSGGPILNQDGELVGINGGLPYSMQDLSHILSPSLIEELEPLSWGIPNHLFINQVYPR